MRKSKSIQQVLSSPPSRFILSLYDFKTAHRKQCAEDFSMYVKTIEEAIGVLGLAVEVLNQLPKNNWPRHRSIQVSFLPGAIETLFCALDDLLDGFYEEATILNRSVFDPIMKIVYLSLHPNKCDIVLGCKAPKGGRKYNVANFMEYELKIDWKFLWSYSSALVHGKNHRAVKMWCDSARGIPRVLSYELKYDKYAVTRPMNEILVYSWCLLRLLILLVPDLSNKKYLGNHGERIENIEASLAESLLGMPNKLKNVVDDFKRIERMVLIAEKG